MEVNIESPLKRIVKGTTILFIGTFLGMFLAFVSRILMARYLTVAEYGMFSIGYAILSIAIMFSLLGLDHGVIRQIGFYRGKRDLKKVRMIVYSAIQISFIISVAVFLLLFISSDFIALNLFHDANVAPILRILSIGIPFLALIMIFVSIYVGFEKATVKTYFQDLLINIIFILFLISILILNLSFINVIYGYVLSIIITFLLITIFIMKISPLKLGKKPMSISHMRKELLIFSLPLLAVKMYAMIMAWTDTIMLGYYRGVDDVGKYNAALLIARAVPIVLSCMMYIYIPIISKLHSQGQSREIKRTYAITTKWVFFVTFPFFLVVILFPKASLNFLFGTRYTGAYLSLQILAFGFFVHVFLGLNSSTLLSLGETRFLMWSSIISTIVNIILNITLIFWMGIIGAALATALSLIFINILISIKCYRKYDIHPFTRNYLKPILASILAIFPVYLISKYLSGIIYIWMLPLLFILFLILYCLSILFTKSFDREDVMIIHMIESKLHINLKTLKNILRRFL